MLLSDNTTTTLLALVSLVALFVFSCTRFLFLSFYAFTFLLSSISPATPINSDSLQHKLFFQANM